MNATDLAARLNLRRYPRSYRGDCPACAYHGAFAIKPRCDGSAMLFCSNGCTGADLAAEVARIEGGGTVQAERAGEADKQAERQRKQDAARRLWAGSEPAAGTLADTYLSGRALPGLAASPALRFRGDCAHPEGGRLPAMVALVVDVAGEARGVHRTYLRRDGTGKATVEPAKASLGPIWTGAIRLDPVAEELVIGEGIETSASAGRLLGLPAWAALSAGNLAKGLALPAAVRAVVIAADPDKPGEEAARAAALRWASEGRTVRIARPDAAGRDFNDLLHGGGHA